MYLRNKDGGTEGHYYFNTLLTLSKLSPPEGLNYASNINTPFQAHSIFVLWYLRFPPQSIHPNLRENGVIDIRTTLYLSLLSETYSKLWNSQHHLYANVVGVLLKFINCNKQSYSPRSNRGLSISKEKNSNVFQALLSNLVSTRIYAVYNTMWSLPKLPGITEKHWAKEISAPMLHWNKGNLSPWNVCFHVPWEEQSSLHCF